METNTTPKRHGCVTAWLIFMLVANALTIAVYGLFGAKTRASMPSMPAWVSWAFLVGAAANCVFAVFLLLWKRWAFYAFCVPAPVVFVINLSIGVPLLSALLGFLGPVVLYLVLQIGGEEKAWSHLK
jgi:hypothetical protein